ncbi:hypothetical protein DYB32_005371 [Aphanomyces invadans]|uniref:protein-tyrosine-phosphatase n=1 Tax=Aphanomyces invadans TaxID=157072 RepID=A0A418AUR0_9STRA|nr:hypothetical protein DYB32_005371 [Aphanomyces invadans]
MVEVAPRPLRSTIAANKDENKIILIWDLDETLLLFSSLCTGQFAHVTGKSSAASVALGESMMCFVFSILEKYLFFDDVEKDTVGHVSHMAHYDDGRSLHQYDFASDAMAQEPDGSISKLRKQAYRYRRIRQIYERKVKVAFLTNGTTEATFCGELRDSIDAFGDGWGRAAQRALQAASTAGCMNILVTNTQLVPALCKCLIYDLDAWFSPDAIYSSSHIRKKQCFDTIRNKYGLHQTYVGLGDGPEEQRASVDCGMSFVEVLLLHSLS